jgi:ATP-binding cassette subfamily B protein
MENPEFRDRLRLAQQTGQAVPSQITDGVAGLAQGTITLVGLVAVLASMNPLLAGLALLSGVPAVLAQLHLGRARNAMNWRISPVERREFFYAELLTSIPAAKELRLFGLTDLFRRRMLGELAAADRERRRLDGRELRVQVLLGALSAIVTGGGLVWAAYAAVRGDLGVGDVSAFLVAMTGLIAGLATLIGRVSMVHQALLTYEHYRSIVGAEPDLAVARDPRPLPELRRGIEFRDVWFRYGPEHEWVLRGLDLFLPYGQSVALVGLNGAGKSTIVKLLCRFYDPERGSIRWDGVDLREVDPVALRERIGAVFQDYMSYDLNAAENIGLGDVAVMDDAARIREAADRAGIDATLAALPRGYQTMLSRIFVDANDAAAPSTGVLLSGGQWQRLALARAFLRDRRDLLILDEPSAGLDAAAEHDIHAKLRRHRAGATSVLISHRLGAVRDSDQIVVLSGGVVAARGTHGELMAAGGEYAELFRLQAEGYRDEVAVP